jgi:Ca2+-binding RTX toxin-like protein
MDLNIVYDASVGAAPSGFTTAVAAAARELDGLITNPITVTIDVGYGEDGGQPLSGDESEGGPTDGTDLTYAQLRADLAANPSTASGLPLSALPAYDPTGGATIELSSAQEKALGLLPADSPEVDGTVGFSSTYQDFGYDPTDRYNPDTTDFIGVAEHELTHALGRLALVPDYPGYDSILDLFRYASPGVLATAATPDPYFSVDGGNTILDIFDTTSDPADWAPSAGPDSFDATTYFGVESPITSVDTTLLSALGFTVNAPPTTIAAQDTTDGYALHPVADPYTGPVAGLRDQYIYITSDSLNVTATSPDWFIHTGGGDDAIAVTSGNNVLDGGTGSNFLTGGSGSDTFFVDDRAAPADIWSTVVNFHAGDAATVWGITAQTATIAWTNAQGAAGYTGLTLHATSANAPTASLTLAGYSMADLHDGRLSTTFGSVGGSPYLYVVANS